MTLREGGRFMSDCSVNSRNRKEALSTAGGRTPPLQCRGLYIFHSVNRKYVPPLLARVLNEIRCSLLNLCNLRNLRTILSLVFSCLLLSPVSSPLPPLFFTSFPQNAIATEFHYRRPSATILNPLIDVMQAIFHKFSTEVVTYFIPIRYDLAVRAAVWLDYPQAVRDHRLTRCEQSHRYSGGFPQVTHICVDCSGIGRRCRGVLYERRFRRRLLSGCSTGFL